MSSHEPDWCQPRDLAQLAGLRLRAQRLVTGLIAGMHRNPRGGFSTEFSEHRAYTPGDDLRRIDWRAFGRTDRLHTRHFEDETNLRSWLIVDGSRSMDYRGDLASLSKWEYAQLMASGLAWIVLQQQDAIGMAIVDSSVRTWVPASSHRGQWDQLLRQLDDARCTGHSDIAAALAEVASRLPRRSVVFLLSDLLDEPDRLTRGIRRLARYEVDLTVFHLFDRSEATFPFDEPAVFLGLEDTARLRAQPDRVRAAYCAEFSAHQEAVRTCCHEHGVDFQACATDVSFDEALRAWCQFRRG